MFPSRSTWPTSTSSTRQRVRRFASLAALLGGVVVAVASAAGPPTGDQLAALAQPPSFSSLASQRIYFAMPDRYANGDPSNDNGGVSGKIGRASCRERV